MLELLPMIPRYCCHKLSWINLRWLAAKELVPRGGNRFRVPWIWVFWVLKPESPCTDYTFWGWLYIFYSKKGLLVILQLFQSNFLWFHQFLFFKAAFARKLVLLHGFLAKRKLLSSGSRVEVLEKWQFIPLQFKKSYICMCAYLCSCCKIVKESLWALTDS